MRPANIERAVHALFVRFWRHSGLGEDSLLEQCLKVIGSGEYHQSIWCARNWGTHLHDRQLPRSDIRGTHEVWTCLDSFHNTARFRYITGTGDKHIESTLMEHFFMESTKLSKRFALANLPDYSDEELLEHFYRFAHRYAELSRLSNSLTEQAFDAGVSDNTYEMVRYGNERDSAKGLAEQVHISMMACQTEMTLRGLTADVSRTPKQPTPERGNSQEQRLTKVAGKSMARSEAGTEDYSFAVPSLDETIGWGWGVFSALLLVSLLFLQEPRNPVPEPVEVIIFYLGRILFVLSIMVAGTTWAVNQLRHREHTGRFSVARSSLIGSIMLRPFLLWFRFLVSM